MEKCAYFFRNDKILQMEKNLKNPMKTEPEMNMKNMKLRSGE